MKRTKFRMKFSTRIIFITLLVSFLSSVLISAVSIMYLQRHLLKESRNHIKSLAEIAAKTLDGDMLEEISAGDMRSSAYFYIFNQLYHFAADDEVMFIYTMRKSGDEVQYVVDATYDIPSPPGEVFPTYDEIERAFRGEITLDSEMTSDKWGTYYSAFAPVYNSRGEVAGIVGIDCSVHKIREKTTVLVGSLMVIEIACMAITGSLSIVAARRMTFYLNEASKDGLTGVYNRRYAARFMADRMDRKRPYGYLLLDIDCFKQVNDTYGHRTGDRVLQALAKILVMHTTNSDVVFRLGGDEFGIFFPRAVTEEQIAQIAREVGELFTSMTEKICPGIPGAGLSFGGIVGEDPATFGDVYHDADALLYQVKNGGKGSCLTGRLHPVEKH